MKMPTSSATMMRTNGNARSGAKVETISTDPTPSSRAAAARNARLKSSSFLRDGFFAMADGIGRKKERRGSPAALHYTVKPEGLLALRLAFLVGRGQRR